MGVLGIDLASGGAGQGELPSETGLIAVERSGLVVDAGRAARPEQRR